MKFRLLFTLMLMLFCTQMAVAFKVRPGPIWNDSDAANKCPAACQSQNGTWTGVWHTVVPGQMSECNCRPAAQSTNCRISFIEAGPLWNDQEAANRCPSVCSNSGGTYVNSYHTTVEGKMSVCACKICSGGTKYPKCQPKDRKAGPLWNDSDAANKCPTVCAKHGQKWQGQWHTTVPGAMSVCSCTGCSN